MSNLHDRTNVKAARNDLLAAMSEDDWLALKPHLEPCAFARGEALFRQGEHVEFITFPCERLVISLRVTSAEGVACEVASVGREGAIGCIVSQGDAPAFATASAQTRGAGWRVSAARLDELKARSASLRRLFARYADGLLAQLMQKAACNALHDVERRIASWLIGLQDRVGGHAIPVTQDDVAMALGVGRPYASRQLNAMKQKGLLDLRRGMIHIRSRATLERSACGCHRAVKAHFKATMAGVRARAD